MSTKPTKRGLKGSGSRATSEDEEDRAGLLPIEAGADTGSSCSVRATTIGLSSQPNDDDDDDDDSEDEDEDDRQAQMELARPEVATDEFLLSAVFNRLRVAALEESEAVKNGLLRDSRARKNRRETYINAASRAKWKTRAMRYLQKHRDRLRHLTPERRFGALYLQHLLELDVADRSLSEGARRFEDSYTDSFSDQFLLDATRARYVIRDEVFHFAEVAASTSSEDFMHRMKAAVQEVVPEELLPYVTLSMSQSGVAAMERGCLCAIVVSGGAQDVAYNLRPDEETEGAVLVTMQVHRHGFGQYLPDANKLVSNGGTAGLGDLDSDEESGPINCSRGHSRIFQEATLRWSGAAGTLEVLDFNEVIDIRRKGRAIPLEFVSEPLTRKIVLQSQQRPSVVEEDSASTVSFTCWERFLLRLDKCWRRCRGRGRARDLDGDRQHLAAHVDEDDDDDDDLDLLEEGHSSDGRH